ncbi:Inositol oxygenase 5 [Sesamum angolense]|uniref:Inositol oxygenase n=1 Tax=Sesamum angolense TaxID=2727404 RepID=A0AAE1TBF7_9LAMI|nr:Inositol oxygenase 5 [Sesamum angolense]
MQVEEVKVESKGAFEAPEVNAFGQNLDLGKVLCLPSFGELPQWAVVGDTFPVGCAFDESIVHHKYFKDNSDINNPAYNTKNGIYQEGCGLDQVLMSWGHDEYMYLVAKENGTTLPSVALFIIRFHSFYPMHKAGAYAHLMNEEDRKNLEWLNIFKMIPIVASKVENGKIWNGILMVSLARHKLIRYTNMSTIEFAQAFELKRLLFVFHFLSQQHAAADVYIVVQMVLDHPGMVMISAPLNGNNWLTWSRSVRIALEGRDRLGFIDGSCPKPAENSAELRQ